MKALVASRLLLGDFDDWSAFEGDRQSANQIVNRRTARSAASQIGKNYQTLSAETKKFIFENFEQCSFDDLAHLCDSIQVEFGLYLRLDQFENKFFPISEKITRRFPFYAHVSISLYGLNFEFPEHHFLSDLETSFKTLAEIQAGIGEFREGRRNPQKQREEIAELIAQEKFFSRSIISAAFSLVESFLSGIFFTAIHTHSFGDLPCDDIFLEYAQKKESDALQRRLNKIINFSSQTQATINDDPFQSFIKFAKHYRDAIHHTTPFERKDIEAGGRLLALYEINDKIALKCALYSLDSVLQIYKWSHMNVDSTVIAIECQKLKDKAQRLLE